MVFPKTYVKHFEAGFLLTLLAFGMFGKIPLLLIEGLGFLHCGQKKEILAGFPFLGGFRRLRGL